MAQKESDNTILISVIIPVYKDAEGLETTLESLSRQTLESSKFEVVVANDGGTEDISRTCAKFGVVFTNIVPNKGSYNARNEAMQLARSDNFAFVDADIEVPEDWLINGLRALETADYVAGPVKIIKKDTMSLAELYEYYTAFSGERYMKTLHFGVTGNLFVKRAVFDKVGTFNNRLRSGGDFEFGNRVYESGAFVQQFSPDISVLHPPRGYVNYIKKVKRVSEGLVSLSRLYPDKYKKIKPTYLKVLARTILPPDLFKTKIYKKKAKPLLQLYFFHWYMNILRGLYTLKAMLYDKD